MVGEGRENKKDNDLFYTCSLIDYVARKTKNTRIDVVNALGKKNLERIYEYADVFHCENIDSVSDEFIEKCNIQEGQFDNVGECKYAIPTYWDIGKVYKRLIKQVSENERIEVIDAVVKVYRILYQHKNRMIIIAAYIMKIHHTYTNHIEKIKCFK